MKHPKFVWSAAGVGAITIVAAVATLFVLVMGLVEDCHSQVVVAPAASATFLVDQDGEVERAGDLIGEVAYQFPWDSEGNHWGELVAIYGAQIDEGDFGGLGIRYYLKRGDIYPGLGIVGFAIDSGPGITETTILAGFEVLLEVPVSTDDRATAFVGMYPSHAGNDVTAIRAGIRAAVN